MTPTMRLPMHRLALLSGILTATVGSQLAVAEAQQAFPVPGAPYSSGVIAPIGATLAVIGNIEGVGADFAAASTDALTKVERRLVEVGLNRGHVLKVRAALAPGDGSEFAGWNTAWTGFFSGSSLPARTTVGSSGLNGEAKIVLDVVAAFPAGVTGDEIQGARATLNPNIRLAGPGMNPTSIVSTRSGLFLSSGALPGRDATAEDPMEMHIRSTMNSLGGTLASHGLQWPDVFFVRVLPTPQPERTTIDYAGWTPVFGTLSEMTGGHAPAWTAWSAPGFGSTGRYVEIEVWATPPAQHPAFEVLDNQSQNRLLRMTGGGGAIAGGALIAPNAELIFLSGVVAPEGTPPEEEGTAALALMAERLAAMGATMADVAELRVYRTQGESGFNQAYGATFNNETNPHRPVRTNYVVESLPSGRTVEVEALVVRPARSF